MLGAILALGLQFSHAQEVFLRRSDREIVELKKMLILNASQEESIRIAFEAYGKRNDSILSFVQDPIQAVTQKRQSEKQYHEKLMSTLTEEQQTTYLRITCTPEVAEKTEVELSQLMKSGTYSETQQDSLRTAIFENMMSKKLLSRKYKYDYSKYQEEMAGINNTELVELKSIITVSPTQEVLINEAYNGYQLSKDSIALMVKNPTEVARLKRHAQKKYDKALMGALSNSQLIEYIQVSSTPEVLEKAEAKIAVLRENGDYTEDELKAEKAKIFNYLMLEKVVYARDKYDYAKQKENIGQLKKLKPAKMVKAETYEKLKVQGKHYQGKIQW